ncbi:MAG TPA: MBL fold metallo-hydrolase [Nocardioidaceae bacterium]|nr:MBL fold metallo-hydrolase [Nocardioidaceae bacterium]
MNAVLQPVENDTLAPATRGVGSLVEAILDDPEALVYFLLNVGDGDTQLLLLPPDSNDGVRRLAIIDVATSTKLPDLIEKLHEVEVSAGGGDRTLIQQPGSPGQIRMVVATHPHFDHIGGMGELLSKYNGLHNRRTAPTTDGNGPTGDVLSEADKLTPYASDACIDQFWEPGYFFPSASFHAMMAELEVSPWIRRLQPTSGTTAYLDSVKVTVMGPGVGLRSRFDTYGVEVNDSSLTLMFEYPASRIYTETDTDEADRLNRRAVKKRSRRLLLGGDAQFTSWAQATIDFPDLRNEQNPVLARELQAARGRDYLASDVFKMSHHASKHGINLELLERVDAKYLLVSSTGGGGRYNFPHALAMDAARESRQATTTSDAARLTDHELGIHVTGAVLDDDQGSPTGSMAVMVPRRPSRAIRIFRLMDGAKEMIDLEKSREVKT